MSQASRLILLCEKAGPREYACIMFQLPDNVKSKIKKLQEKINKEDIHPEEGLEDDIHITLLYGIFDGNEVKEKARELLKSEKPVQAHTGDVEIFEPKGEDYDVVVLRVHGKALHDLRSKVEDSLPNEQTFPTYKPHITIGYVKKGTGRKYKDLSTSDISFITKTIKYSSIDDTETLMDIGLNKKDE